MALTRVTGNLDTDLWHKVTSGVWFGKIPPDFYPLYSRPGGKLVSPNVLLDDPYRWALSVGGVFNTAHNLSAFALSLGVAGTNGAAATIITPRGNSEGFSAVGMWGYGGFIDFPETNLSPKGDVGFDIFPRADSQTFVLSLSVISGVLSFVLTLGDVPYELYTAEVVMDTPEAGATVNAMVNCLICGFSIDQYEAEDDGEGGYNYVGSPVCVLDWVNFASVE